MALKVRFNDLPQVVRERLLAALTNPQDPRRIITNLDARLGWFKYVAAVGGVAAIVGFLDFFVREGSRKDPWHDREVYLFFAGTVWIFVTAVIGIVYRFLWKPPPYREGNFVFKSAIVNTDGGELEIMPLHELGRPTIVHTRRNGVYSGSRLELQHHEGKSRLFQFFYGSQDAVQAGCDSVLDARQAWVETLRAGNVAKIQADDIFAECTLSDSWTAPAGTPPAPPLVPVVPKAARWARWLGGLVFSVGVAGLTYVIIDNVFESDRKEYQDNFSKPKKKGKGYY